MNLLLLSTLLLFNTPIDYVDSVSLQAIEIVAPMKIAGNNERQPYSSSTFGRVEIEEQHLRSIKDFSALSPNFYQPEYGSSMTSSIYVRGFGSRMDQPIIGLNIDNQPILNKNNYDFDLYDISKVQIMRGAQSTLFGRNTVGGVINIHTLSPLVFQGKRFTLEYGTANSIRAKASHYAAPSEKFGWSASINFAHTDGFFKNNFSGENCDKGDNLGIRLRHQLLPNEKLSFDNSFSINYTDEGGYAYKAYDAGNNTLLPVSYNDPCTYRRFNISDGLSIKYTLPEIMISSNTGYQFTHDRMRIDNDFLPMNYFSMGQYQHDNSLTQEFIAKSKDTKKFNWLTGLFGFYKHQRLSAPVLFKKDGIDNLILENANNGIQTAFPNALLSFREENFPIQSRFETPTLGLALYGQIGYKIGKLHINGGLRFDYEQSTLNYNSHATIHYKLTPFLDNFKKLSTKFKGSTSLHASELLPQLSFNYELDKSNIYFSLSKGFKAGGFNTQLFSDILQRLMMNNLMQEFGVNIEGGASYDNASATTYKPEHSWNYELGTHINLLDNSLQLSTAFFYIDCYNQQLTVFPKGETTGRMMSNAGRSRSYGAEASIRYTYERVTINASYGYTHATFKRYESGNSDFSGKHLPYAPEQTMSANISYRIPASSSFAKRVIANIGYSGIGRIYWNESNTLYEPFHCELSASVSWEKGHFGGSLWCKNLLNRRFNTFYFKSIGHDFFTQNKPMQVGFSAYFNL